jgi:hypothetical protein
LPAAFSTSPAFLSTPFASAGDCARHGHFMVDVLVSLVVVLCSSQSCHPSAVIETSPGWSPFCTQELLPHFRKDRTRSSGQ